MDRPRVAEGDTLIVGAGYVGLALADLLRAQGKTAYTLSRHPQPSACHLQADITSPKTLRKLPKSIDALVFAAAPSSASDESYQKLYVEGFANILSALEASNLRRLIFVSSTSVYGEEQGEIVDETVPASPRSFHGERILEAESLLGPYLGRGAAVRFGGIYGPGRERLISMIESGAPLGAAGLDHFSNRIHRDDCAALLAHLLELPVLQPVYLGVDDEPAPLREILQWLAKRLDKPFPATVDDQQSFGSRMRGNKRCANTRVRESGYRFLYPTYREGFESILAAR